MEPNPYPSTSGDHHHPPTTTPPPPSPPQQQQQQQLQPPPLSRYEAQKRRDWNTFLQYLRNHKPPIPLSRSSGKEVIEFLRYLDQFGKTKVHSPSCSFYGEPNPPSACACPLRQAWGSLDALVGRLRAAYEENGGKAEDNPFGARAVRAYLREVRDSQAKARGVAYEKKRRRKVVMHTTTAVVAGGEAASSSGGGAAAAVGSTRDGTVTVARADGGGGASSASGGGHGGREESGAPSSGS